MTEKDAVATVATAREWTKALMLKTTVPSMVTISATLKRLKVGADDGEKIANGMVMGMREKLIELLKEAMVLSDGICRIVGNTQAVAIGHYLFANGVRIPVLCKDCKYWKPGDSFSGDSLDDMQRIGGCPIMRFGRRENDFCCEGERRTDDE